MKVKLVLPIIFFLMHGFSAHAISVPSTSVNSLLLEDTTIQKTLPNTNASRSVKKVGFFGRLQQNLRTFILKNLLPSESKISSKTAFGLTSLVLFACVGVLAFATSGGSGHGGIGGGAYVAALLFILALIAGIIFLFKKKKK